MTFTLRAADAADLDFIVAQEARPGYEAFIHRWSRDTHARNLNSTAMRYLVAEAPDRGRGGYVILNGLDSPARSVELTRIVATPPGAGIGAELLAQVIELVFDALEANRLWLDVFDDNDRARRAYRRAGFQEEGLLREAALRGDGSPGSLVIMAMLARERPLSRPARRSP